SASTPLNNPLLTFPERVKTPIQTSSVGGTAALVPTATVAVVAAAPKSALPTPTAPGTAAASTPTSAPPAAVQTIAPITVTAPVPAAGTAGPAGAPVAKSVEEKALESEVDALKRDIAANITDTAASAVAMRRGSVGVEAAAAETLVLAE